jgi:hypothetical protein
MYAGVLGDDGCKILSDHAQTLPNKASAARGNQIPLPGLVIVRLREREKHSRLEMFSMGPLERRGQGDPRWWLFYSNSWSLVPNVLFA